jgi:hypothetical protein
MTVDYFILCHGRTFFTQLTVDSILARAKHEPRITLINTGWTHPVWHEFAQSYIADGKVARIVDATIVNHNPATPYGVPDFIGDAPYYFITDNDCLAPVDEDGQSFDEYGFSILDDNPSVNRVGYLLFRDFYVERFPEWAMLKPHMVKPISDPPDSELKVHPKTCGGVWNSETRRAAATSDPRMIKMMTDTTFTIVRKPHKLGHANRYSHVATTSFPTSHIGYLEMAFLKQDHVEEMLLYMADRARNICPEFRHCYQNRLRGYRELVNNSTGQSESEEREP